MAQPQRVGAFIAHMIDPKATVYHGVTMRSRLEADFARHLDGLGMSWVYEPTLFGPVGRGYLPDFRLDLGERPCYVEVKPTLREAVAAQRRMRVIWTAYPTATLIVACAQESRYFAAEAGGPWRTFVERWDHA
jgi:hypothetical protein